MRQVPIHRQIRSCEETELIKKDDFMTFLYHYDSLSVKSHVQPHFIVYNAGLKLVKHLKELIKEFPALERPMSRTLAVFNSWTSLPPPEDFLQTDAPETSHGSSSPAGLKKMNPRRYPKKDYHLRDCDSPTPSSKKRKMDGDNVESSTSITLINKPVSRLEGYGTSNREDYRAKMSSICRWRENLEVAIPE
jgi:hypothetical protein